MQCGGEATSDDRRPLVGTGDGSNLYNYIDHDRVWGVNIEPPESAKVALKPWDERHSMDRYMESGVDDQMIVTIPFTCPVRIQSILLFAGRSDMAVRRCAAFVNRPHGIDFDEALSVLDGRLGPATSGRAQADFALLENAAQVTSYPVSASRFAHTNSVSLLLSDSLAGTTSRMYYIGFVGKALDPRADTTKTHDVPAATSATHSVDGVSQSYSTASTPSGLWYS
ncbi:hypothetical protein Malapachy_3105 [Malassezia pachydermatis]|uniref:PITH domain-containing protein n=1 Tax=Malassezia pachydermatis TaxID=77020 RepID=A0A0M8MP92_9BASI|nr:hypothetical protein Malapachy_3105 [Malassezia pachydermatis]KOS16486.1 hypothetical protein Malapachy_3105 [Malassezia pachydermatis]